MAQHPVIWYNFPIYANPLTRRGLYGGWFFMKRIFAILLLALLFVQTCTVASAAGNGETIYRALLIGVDAYQAGALEGCVNDINRMAQTLQTANEAGAFYQAPVLRSNLTSQEIGELATDMATWNVDEDDVTFFFFAGRGYLSDKGTPAIVGKDNKMFSIADLIQLLDGLKGTKMVALDMRLADEELLEKGETQVDPLKAQVEVARFNQEVLGVFRESPNAGRYYVLAGSTLTSSETDVLPAGDEPRGLVTYLLTQGCGYDYREQRPVDQMPADTNGNGAVSLTEIRDYITEGMAELEGSKDPVADVAISPEGSTYPLMARRATSEVLEVTLIQDSIEVPMGRTRQLEAETQPPNASKRTIAWSSADLSIATVDDDGVVTGVKPGLARIAATTANGLTVFADVTVRDVTMVESFTLSTSALTVGSGNTVQMNVRIEPEDASENYSWSTDNSAIATVDQNGLVTCRAIGDTQVTIASESGVEASCAITVVDPKDAVTGIKVNKSELELYVGGTFVAKTRIKPAEALHSEVTFTSSDPAVASISGDSIITGVAPGTCTVYATASSGIYAPIAVTVKGPELLLNKDSLNMKIGASTILKTRVKPTSAEGEIIWTSEDPTIASVEKGKITAMAEGETVITASLGDSTTAQCQVVVGGVPVKKISIKPEKLSLEVGATTDLSFQLAPKNASTTGLQWSSSQEDIAVVDAEGHVNAVATGKAVIQLSAPGGVKAICRLEVEPVSITALSLDQSDIELLAGSAEAGRFTLTAQTQPEGAGNGSVKWRSSNPKVATVSSTGEVVARRAGKAVIKAVGRNGGRSISAQCNVTVEANAVRNPKPIVGEEKKVYTSARRIQYAKDQLLFEMYFANGTDAGVTVPEEGKLVLTLADGRQLLVKEIPAGTNKLKPGKTGTLNYTVTVAEGDELYGLDLRGASAEILPPDAELNAGPAPETQETFEIEEEDTGEDDMDWDAPDPSGWKVED